MRNGVKEDVIGHWSPGQRVLEVTIGGEKVVLQVEQYRGGYTLLGRGSLVNASVRTVRSNELARRMQEKQKENLGGRLVSPMPGKVVSVFVEEGQRVRAGDSLVVIDAMKMENLLCAESEGIVGAIHVSPGDSLSVEQIILEMVPAIDT